MEPRLDDRTEAELHRDAHDGDAEQQARGYGRCCRYCGGWIDPDEPDARDPDGDTVHLRCLDPDERLVEVTPAELHPVFAGMFDRLMAQPTRQVGDTNANRRDS